MRNVLRRGGAAALAASVAAAAAYWLRRRRRRRGLRSDAAPRPPEGETWLVFEINARRSQPILIRRGADFDSEVRCRVVRPVEGWASVTTSRGRPILVARPDVDFLDVSPLAPEPGRRRRRRRPTTTAGTAATEDGFVEASAGHWYDRAAPAAADDADDAGDAEAVDEDAGLFVLDRLGRAPAFLRLAAVRGGEATAAVHARAWAPDLEASFAAGAELAVATADPDTGGDFENDDAGGAAILVRRGGGISFEDKAARASRSSSRSARPRRRRPGERAGWKEDLLPAGAWPGLKNADAPTDDTARDALALRVVALDLGDALRDAAVARALRVSVAACPSFVFWASGRTSSSTWTTSAGRARRARRRPRRTRSSSAACAPGPRGAAEARTDGGAGQRRPRALLRRTALVGLEAAQRALDRAEAGGPVVVVGDAPDIELAEADAVARRARRRAEVELRAASLDLAGRGLGAWDAALARRFSTAAARPREPRRLGEQALRRRRLAATAPSPGGLAALLRVCGTRPAIAASLTALSLWGNELRAAGGAALGALVAASASLTRARRATAPSATRASRPWRRRWGRRRR
ncbi:hypothetical protein SO694_00102032 [Aureococcus anophagefferens]|uniref:Uncharacterized protein n=1 Tax=Aureococcus anophagefferens TaxID=44056 RepID=A0ABR1FNC3_AURAN